MKQAQPASRRVALVAALSSAALLTSCAVGGGATPPDPGYSVYSRQTVDDLALAGLTVAQLRGGGISTTYLDPIRPTAAEIRRNLILQSFGMVIGTWTTLYGPNVDPATERSNGSDGRIAGD
jgi:hypothetical protein